MSVVETPNDRPFVFALDLGSDTTVCYARFPGANESVVPLQYFAPGLTQTPLLHREDGRVSHRLRSRLLINQEFEVPSRLTPRLHEGPLGLKPILPVGHGTVQLLDHSKEPPEYLPNWPGLKSTLFKYFHDEDIPFPFRQVIPNAKLIFQSGVMGDLKADAVYRDEENWERTQSLDVDPGEMISDIVCQILENFVRRHPQVIHANDGLPPSWSQSKVILTVPNTYSPAHRRLLTEAVQMRLAGTLVETITESDAIVDAYIQDARPFADQPADMVHHVVIYDVGKGTTDLTLVVLENKVPDEETAIRFGLSRREVYTHVTNAARAGRESGGAKATFLVANLLESLIRKALEGINEAGAFRPLTSRSGEAFSVIADEALLAFERLSELHKHGMTPDGKLTELAGEVPNQLLTYYTSISRDPEKVRETLGALLKNPELVRKESKENKEIFKRFDEQLEAYIRDNVDDILLDLVADFVRTQGIKPRNVQDALNQLYQKGASEEGGVRIHFIVSGQGSLLAPLRDRLEVLLRRARFSEPIPISTIARGRLEKSTPALLKKIIGTQTKSLGTAINGYFEGKDRKDACARGALIFATRRGRFTTNPWFVHGQIIVEIQGGLRFEEVDMEALNRGEVVPFSYEDANGQPRSDERIIWYLPTPGMPLMADGSPDRTRIFSQGMVLASIPWGNGLSIKLSPDVNGDFQVLSGGVPVLTQGNRRQENPEAKRRRSEILRPLLWPMTLLEAEGQ